MKTIYKFGLGTGPEAQDMVLPRGAALLGIDEQPPSPGLQAWFLLDPEEKETETQTFYVVGTGRPVPEGVTSGHHRVTVPCLGGLFIWHVFQKVS